MVMVSPLVKAGDENTQRKEGRLRRRTGDSGLGMSLCRWIYLGGGDGIEMVSIVMVPVFPVETSLAGSAVREWNSPCRWARAGMRWLSDCWWPLSLGSWGMLEMWKE